MTKRRKSVGVLTVRMTKGYGVDVVVDIQATRLTELGYDVAVYTTEYDTDYYAGRNYRIFEVPGPTNKLLSYLKNCRHDCLIAHSSPFFEMLPLLTPFVPTICYEHGDPNPSLFPEQERHVRERMKWHKRSYVYPQVTKVIAISRFVAHDIGYPGATVIYNGGDHLSVDGSARCDDIRQSFARRHRLDPTKTFILCVFRLGQSEANYKGGDLFLEFKERLGEERRYEFIVLGRGAKGDEEDLVKHGVRVILNATRQELLAAYCSSDIFVSFSKWEGFNLPLVEAESFGKPGFAIDWACHAEVTPLVYRDCRTIADVIRNLPREEMKALGRQCKEFASRFVWEKNVASLEEVIWEVTNQPAGTEGRGKRAGKKTRAMLYELYFRTYNALRRYPAVVSTYRSLLVHAAGLRRLVEASRNDGRSRQGVDPATFLPPSRPPIRARQPYTSGLVSICILTKNKLDLIRPCVESVTTYTPPTRIEILVGDTGTTEREVFEYYRSLPPLVRLFYYNSYNFSANNNNLANQARGEFIIFLNNDTKVTEGWLDLLFKPFRFSNVAVIGPKLLFADNLIQHAGVEIYSKEPYRYVGWHPYARFPAGYPDTNYHKSVPGVTGSCMAVRHEIFDKVGGYDEKYQEECQDLDLCFEVKIRGYRIVYTPECCIYHYENMSRTVKESLPDRELFKKKWKTFIDGAIFTQPTQSERWAPLVCVYLTGDGYQDRRKVAEVIALAREFSNLIVTVKGRTMAASESYNSLLQGLNLRNLTMDYEDSTRYDHILR